MAGEANKVYDSERDYSVYLDLAWGPRADPQAWEAKSTGGVRASVADPVADGDDESREVFIEAMSSTLAARSPWASAAVGGGMNRSDGSVLDVSLSVSAPDSLKAVSLAVLAVEDAYEAAYAEARAVAVGKAGGGSEERAESRAASERHPIEESLAAFSLRSVRAEPEKEAGPARAQDSGEALDLVGTTEIMQILGLDNRKRAAYISHRWDFPRPVGQPKIGPVWRREDILEYKRKNEQG